MTTDTNTQELNLERSLRPKFLGEYIGQERIKENLKVFIGASKKRCESLDHVLFYGPPGLGKTSLSYIIANELCVGIKSTSGPVIEKPGDLAAILTNLKDRDVLFIDEIHRLGSVVEEILYPAMEDFKLDIMIGQGPSARSIKIDLPRFTLVGATTRAGLLTSPLRDRFGVVFHIELYSVSELLEIVIRSSKIINVKIEESGACEIAKRSRGTPRIANTLLKRVRDFADHSGDGIITDKIADMALSRLDIDKNGLTSMDRKILNVIIEKFNGGPVGIETISAAVNEDKGTIEDVYEPFLVQAGFVDKTQRGRIATAKAFEHLGIKFKKRQETLF